LIFIPVYLFYISFVILYINFTNKVTQDIYLISIFHTLNRTYYDQIQWKTTQDPPNVTARIPGHRRHVKIWPRHAGKTDRRTGHRFFCGSSRIHR